MSVDGKRHETILYVMGMMGLIHNLRYDGCQEKFAIAEKALDEAMDVLLEGLTVQELTRIKKETEMLDISIAPRSASKRTENWIAMSLDDLEFFLKDPLGECYFCVKTDAEVKACPKRKKLQSLYIDGLSRENCPYKGL